MKKFTMPEAANLENVAHQHYIAVITACHVHFQENKQVPGQFAMLPARTTCSSPGRQ